MKNRSTWQLFDAIGDTEVVITCVPLNKDGKHGRAEIEPEDYDGLIQRGISGNWYRTSRGQVGVAVRGKNQLVARLLLDLGPNEVVEFKDGNPRNLRRENLWVRKSTGAWKPRVVVRREREPLASDVKSWVDRIGSGIAGQNAFNAISVGPIERRAPARFRK